MVIGKVMRSTWRLDPGDLHTLVFSMDSGRSSSVELIPVVRNSGTVGWVPMLSKVCMIPYMLRVFDPTSASRKHEWMRALFNREGFY